MGPCFFTSINRTDKGSWYSQGAGLTPLSSSLGPLRVLLSTLVRKGCYSKLTEQLLAVPGQSVVRLQQSSMSLPIIGLPPLLMFSPSSFLRLSSCKRYHTVKERQGKQAKPKHKSQTKPVIPKPVSSPKEGSLRPGGRENRAQKDQEFSLSLRRGLGDR